MTASTDQSVSSASATALSDPPVFACPECDLIQGKADMPERGVALCVRCGADLYRKIPNSVQRTLAFTVTALLLFVLANSFPLMELELQGTRNASTLLGAVHALFDQRLGAVGMLVLATTVLVPLIEMSAVLYLLLPLRAGRRARGYALVYRLTQVVQPWGMIEVFMLGVLVSVVKLSTVATVIPGIALWSFAGLMLALSAAAGSFNRRDIWHALESAR